MSMPQFSVSEPVGDCLMCICFPGHMQCVRVFPPTQVSPIHGKYKERIAQEQRKCSQETENNDTGSPLGRGQETPEHS